MGGRLVSIISVAPIREPQLENFAKGFNQYNISVYSGKTHCRKVFCYLGMDIFNTGMAFTFGKNFSDSQPLRR